MDTARLSAGALGLFAALAAINPGQALPYTLAVPGTFAPPASGDAAPQTFAAPGSYWR